MSSARAGFGGLLRDHVGNWVQGYCGYAGSVYILFAELLAINCVLLRAWELHVRTLLCESDSLEAVRFVTSSEMDVYHLYWTIIADIKLLMARNWKVTVNHVFREANSCADMLAHMGLIRMKL